MERAFSLDKRCYGMGLITTKLEETQLVSIVLSVFVSNLFKMQRQILFALFYIFHMCVSILIVQWFRSKR